MVLSNCVRQRGLQRAIGFLNTHNAPACSAGLAPQRVSDGPDTALDAWYSGVLNGNGRAPLFGAIPSSAHPTFGSICQDAARTIFEHVEHTRFGPPRQQRLAHGPAMAIPRRRLTSVAAPELAPQPARNVFHASEPVEHAPEATLYKVEFVTGDKRGAGTPCPAILRVCAVVTMHCFHVVIHHAPPDGWQQHHQRQLHSW